MSAAGPRQMVLFFLAVILLGGSALGLQAAKEVLQLQLIKKPIPLRKPLDDFDRSYLSPYKLVRVQKLSPEVVVELGTEEYLNWVLHDESSDGKPGSVASLSVTYYTGVQDQVPHVPEECMYQANYIPTGDFSFEITVPWQEQNVPLRRLLFKPPPSAMVRGTTNDLAIYYTIAVNGAFETSRNMVRTHMLDWRDSHLYYSKVELTFQCVPGSANGALDDEAGRLMGMVLTELVKSHWPVPGSERTEIPDRGS